MPRRPSPTAQLVQAIEDAGGELVVSFREFEDRVQLERKLRAAVRYNLVPEGKIIRYRYAEGGGWQLQLADRGVRQARSEAAKTAEQREWEFIRADLRVQLSEEARLALLNERIAEWERRERIARYIDAMERSAEDDPVRAESTRQWCEWVREQLAKTDGHELLRSMPSDIEPSDEQIRGARVRRRRLDPEARNPWMTP